MNYPKAEMKLSSSVSEQNIYLTYVCTINEVKPDGHLNNDSKHNLTITDAEMEIANQKDDHIKVERSKALHELVDVHADDNGVIVEKDLKVKPSPYPTTSSDCEDTDGSEIKDAQHLSNDNPRMLKLTKMKWLSEGHEGSPDSRSPSLSSVSSNTSSQGSRESQTNLRQHRSFANKYLSTILRLDKEHNLFGLSNIAIVGSKASKKSCKKDEKAVFHQTAIVQICCGGKSCCKHMSNTNLPSSLKCRSRGCYSASCDPCSLCGTMCGLEPTCPSVSSLTCSRTGNCKGSCFTPKCWFECKYTCGLQMTVKRKPKYDPPVVELTPRSSCVFVKPTAARSCHHLPQCLPPSSCFPYLMPCYWPARPGAPCSHPTRCFHNPPCRPPRIPRSNIPIEDKCPPKCENKCPIMFCPGVKNNTERKPLCAEMMFSSDTELKKKKKRDTKVYCECSVPQCASCFVAKPKESSKSIALQKGSSHKCLLIADELISPTSYDT